MQRSRSSPRKAVRLAGSKTNSPVRYIPHKTMTTEAASSDFWPRPNWLPRGRAAPRNDETLDDDGAERSAKAEDSFQRRQAPADGESFPTDSHIARGQRQRPKAKKRLKSRQRGKWPKRS